MSSEASSEEKEFDPSPRRLQKARDEGRVPLSKDVNSAVQMVIVLMMFIFLGGDVISWFCEATRDAIILVGQGNGRGNSFVTSASRQLDAIGWAAAPVPYYEWVPLRAGAAARLHYLQEVLAAAVAPRPPASGKGWRVAGWRVADWRPAGWRFAGWRPAGWRVAGGRPAGWRPAGFPAGCSIGMRLSGG